MKRFLIILISTLILLTGCSTANIASPEAVSQKVFSEYKDIIQIYSMPSTDTEYVYLVSVTSGMIIVFYVEKSPPHNITKLAPLFRCVCEGPKEST